MTQDTDVVVIGMGPGGEPAGAYADFVSVTLDGLRMPLPGAEGWTGTSRPRPGTSWTGSPTWKCTPTFRTAYGSWLMPGSDW